MKIITKYKSLKIVDDEENLTGEGRYRAIDFYGMTTAQAPTLPILKKKIDKQRKSL